MAEVSKKGQETLKVDLNLLLVKGKQVTKRSFVSYARSLPKKFQKKKGLMATWDDSESEEEDSDEEQAAVALMASAGAKSEVIVSSDAESDSDEEDEVLSPFSPYELKACL